MYMRSRSGMAMGDRVGIAAARERMRGVRPETRRCRSANPTNTAKFVRCWQQTRKYLRQCPKLSKRSYLAPVHDRLHDLEFEFEEAAHLVMTSAIAF